jgi:hypothetical protein
VTEAGSGHEDGRLEESAGSSRLGNGLSAATFVPLAEVDADLGATLLNALGRARIAAYLEPSSPATRRLFVAADERTDARTIIVAASRGADQLQSLRVADEFDGRDTDAEFEALIGDWHVDTINAIRSAEKDLAREDSDWRARLVPVNSTDSTDDEDEEEHYIPPSPPPLPRLAGYTIGALTLVAISISILVLGLGGNFGLASDLTILLGVGGILVGAGMLVMRLREHPDEDDDDGAVL